MTIFGTPVWSSFALYVLAWLCEAREQQGSEMQCLFSTSGMNDPTHLDMDAPASKVLICLVALRVAQRLSDRGFVSRKIMPDMCQHGANDLAGALH
ncbi:hypothetical protein K470DRAFT_2932 [Piedraia hortae CBS 480.64]|uniref:Uncharacterized protein n=1 Tax=Piedraia hortae CBS 480.64 TaxID=1314780 RepID=A0A6A7CB33_9PEZI|nr:hypothetical protein K470DRAFT_2932 [Piedraia hortae CBS 480.64]